MEAKIIGNELPVVICKLAKGETIIAQKRAFLCSEKGVDISMHFRKKLGAGFFGGEGFIMQKMTGPGTVYLQSMPISKLSSLLYIGNAK